MPTVFIIHGSYGSPNDNWIPWLKRKLEHEGNNVFAPAFPTPEKQSLSSWMNVFEHYKDKIDADTIFIGHSLGVAFILRLLEKSKIRIKASFFVSGFVHLLHNQKFDTVNSTFLETEFEWKKIISNCRTFYLFQGNDDPFVPIEEGMFLAKQVGGSLTIITKGGHLNTHAGYTNFELLLEEVKKKV